MKYLRDILVILLFSMPYSQNSAQDTLFFEDFHGSPGSKPEGWTTELEAGGSKWQFVNGGGTKDPEKQGSRRPPTAYSDTVNALYFFESLEGEEVILITPPIDLEFAVKPELKFMHAQREGNLGFGLAHDELRVYYKTHFDSAWVESRKLAEYTDEVFDWTQQTVLLPEESCVPECYLAFRAKTNYGWGVCLDDVGVVETGVQPREVDTVLVRQESTSILPGGTANNPILRIDIPVSGNTGNLTLNSVEINSLNTADSDIRANGVKLYYRHGSRNLFSAELIDSAGFSDGAASFSSLSLNLPTGNNYFWITYDLEPDAGHGNQADALVRAGSINIGGSSYPGADASPAGSRLIQESVFTDDFSTDKGWTLNGDFERNRPGGLGGNFLGNPDPLYASGDTMILGNDLTGLGSNIGDYEASLSRYDNLATSPVINLFYFNDIRLNYLRWLNVANNDTASIELSVDNGSSWTEIWSNNNNVFTDGNWNFISQSLDLAARQSQVRIRFNLGPTTETDHFSGWNLENLSITGNYVEYDVGAHSLLAPEPGCGHSPAETVRIRVKNYGPADSPVKIPVRYSFDGGSSFVTDTITGPVSFDGEVDFDFSQEVDLSTPGVYDVHVETTLNVDEESSNDGFDTILYVDPSYTLPYVQDFQEGMDYWRVEGNSSLEYGVPAGGVIHTAASPPNAWVTNLDGNYRNGEDGYLLGPCFDFTGIDYPVFECMLFMNTESEDGARLEYSLNNGQTWSRVGNLGDGDSCGWNWYNSDLITALPGGHGWTGNTGDWKLARILLDTNIFRNAQTVKFRFHFASDASGVLEGIGIDDIKIYDAPRDIGVVSIEYPVTGCAQDIGDHVAVTIRNFGSDTLMAGDTLILGYDFDGEPTVVDTLVLESNLLKNQTLPYTFRKNLRVTSSGMKDVLAFSLLPEDTDFYNDTITNDTTLKSISVTLTPFVYLPEAIYTVRPDTIILNAYTGETGDKYLWQDASTDSVFHVTAFADGIYHVTASNEFCSYRDTTYVYRLIADAGVTGILEPVSDCELGAAVQPVIRVTNFGTDTLHIGDAVPLRYRIDGGSTIEETVLLSKTIWPDSSFEYTFIASSDMSMIRSYDLTAYTELPYDDTLANDTLHAVVEAYGITDIDLGPDTLVRALEYLIDAGAGYDYYLWQDGSGTQTLLADTSGIYTVTVKEGTKCENSDSIYLTLIVPDISVVKLDNPMNACGLSQTESIDLYVYNSGTDTLHSGDTIALTYQINSGGDIPDTLFVNRTVVPGDSVMFSSAGTADLSGQGIYEFEVNACYSKDLLPGNNSFNQAVEIYGFPEVSLGPDRVVNTLTHTLDAGGGFVSYLWQDGSTARELTIDYRDQTPDSTYAVTVTDQNGCPGTDGIKLGFDVADLSITNILSPSSACRLTDQEQLNVLVMNSGTRSIVNEQIKIVASFDRGLPVTGQKTLTRALEPGDSLEFLFGITFDLSGEGPHDLLVYSIYGNDANPDNDTVNMVITHYGTPDVDLGSGMDSLGVSLPYTLDAGADYTGYIWNGTPGNRTFEATNAGWYTLEVTDIWGCTGTDSVYLRLSNGISDIALPGDLLVYPNPASEMLTIEYRTERSGHYFLEIFNMTGEKIIQREYEQIHLIRESMDVSEMAKGMYFILLRSELQHIIKPLIIE